MEDDTYVVRLTEPQIALLRKELSKRAMFVKDYPLSIDEPDLAERLMEIEKILWRVHQCT